jgi:hypothetical protein
LGNRNIPWQNYSSSVLTWKVQLYIEVKYSVLQQNQFVAEQLFILTIQNAHLIYTIPGGDNRKKARSAQRREGP